MTRKKADKVMLLDGDIIVFSQVTNNEFITEEHSADDEWWEVLDAKAVKNEIASRIDELEGMLHCKDTIIAFGSKSNFRKKIFPPYKASRGFRKPLGYFGIVDWCFENYTCTRVPSLEADDILGVLHTRKDLVEDETIVVSIDKDMRTIPGLLYSQNDIKSFKPTLITDRDAVKFLAIQSLAGDTGDGYKGCPGIGPVKAEALVEPHLDEAIKYDDPMSYLFWACIYDAYITKGCPGIDALQQCQMARILRGDDIIVTDTNEWELKLWEPEKWNRKKHSKF